MSVESVVQTIRLLVVDDEVIVGKRLKQIFDKMGYEVEVRTDGASAIELMEEKKFDIVITDLKMDGMDGMQVLSRVRELNPATKVIIITGYAQMETSQQAFREGPGDGYDVDDRMSVMPMEASLRKAAGVGCYL